MIIRYGLLLLVLGFGYVFISDAYQRLDTTASITPVVVIVGTLLLMGLVALGFKSGFFASVQQSFKNRQKALSASEKFATLSQAHWIHAAVWMLVLLSVVLTLVWAWKAPDDNLVRWFFCLGFIGMVIMRDRILPAAVNAWQQGNGLLLGLTIVVSLVTTGSLLGTSLFELVNESGNGAQVRLESSAPAQALDNEISITRERLRGMATFADAEKAHSETQAHNQSVAAAQAKTAEIKQQLAALVPPSFPSRFSKFMHSDCSPKTDGNGLFFRTKARQLCPEWEAMSAAYQQQKSALEAQLPTALFSGTDYADKHAEYKGLQNHLVKLEKDRAALSESGQGIKSQWKAEDRMLSRFFDVSAETASWLKWMVWAFIFDLIAVIGLIVAQMLRNIAGGDKRAENRRVLRGLELLGVDASAHIKQALSGAFAVGAEPVPHAKTAPQLKQGGWVQSDGLVHAHADEAVLNSGAAAALEKISPGLIDELNALHRDGDALGTPNGADALGAANIGTANIGTAIGTPNAGDDALGAAKGTPNIGTPSSAVVYQGFERVPAHLSQRAGKGRTSKIDVCKDCGKDFIVLAHNACRCKECATKAEKSYQRRQLAK